MQKYIKHFIPASILQENLSKNDKLFTINRVLSPFLWIDSKNGLG